MTRADIRKSLQEPTTAVEMDGRSIEDARKSAKPNEEWKDEDLGTNRNENEDDEMDPLLSGDEARMYRGVAARVVVKLATWCFIWINIRLEG